MDENTYTRVEMTDLRQKVEIGAIFLTRYEKSRIIGARALQVSFGAPILTDLPASSLDPMRVSEKELREKVLPLTIRRAYPEMEGEKPRYQDIPVNWLIFEE